jgi:ankyrin repeat protein
VKYARLLTLVCVALPCLANLNSGLVSAIKEQNRERIAELLKNHADVNAALPDGATPLAWAVYLDEADVVDSLLSAGAKVNTADQYGETPLTLACATGDFPIIQKLIAAGADATAARWNGETALMLASRSGTVQGVKLLLEQGAKVNEVESRKGQNALMWAAAEGHSQVVQLLLDHGADVTITSKGGFTPLVFAAQKGDVKSVQSLLDAGLAANYVLPNGTSLLGVAISGGKQDVAIALMEHGADVNTPDKEGNTPLHIAAQSGELRIVGGLLLHGANPNAVNAKAEPPKSKSPFRVPIGQQTPLMLAARANHEDVMRALVAGGADPKIKAQDGTTLLMSAAGSGHIGPVKYAYELDPDVKAVTTRKSTVMHSAVTGTFQLATQPEICEVIQFLADKGADLDDEDINGRTPMTIANFIPIDHAVTLMTKLIVDRGGTPKHPAKR